MKRFCGLTLILILATCWCASAQTSKVKVTLKSRAVVKADGMVRLRDIAQVRGSAAQIRDIGQVAVLVAPKPGHSKTVDAEYIERKLQSVRIKNVQMDGAVQVDIEGECVRVAPDEIVDTAKAFLTQLLPTLSKGTYNISTSRDPEELVLPAGEKLDLVPRMMFGEPKVGSNYVLVDAKVDGKVVETARVNLKASVMIDALTASAAIRRGEVIDSRNTSITQIEAVNGKEYLTGDIICDTDPVVSSRTLMPGTPICAGDIANQIAVKKGDMVTVVVRCGNVKLAAAAQAKQDGCKGDSIMVRSDISTDSVQARVIEPGIVEIKR